MTADARGAAAGPPGPREQLTGLTFAVLLVSPGLLIREVNPAGENLLGQSTRRLRGRPLLDVLDFGDPLVRNRLLEGDVQLTARGARLRVEEREIVANLTVSPMPQHPGWRVMTLSDAGQGERLSEGGENQSGLRGPAVLAHEIKNPLAAIRGAAQLVGRKLPTGERGLTRLITDEVDRIAELIDRMQRLGRERAQPIGPLNLHATIRRALATVHAARGPGTVREEFDPSLPPVLGNEGALVQVLINLLANARDASDGMAVPEVVIRTRFVSGLVMNVMRLGRPVKLPIEVQVSDNGPGIDPAIRDHIFEPFVSAKKNGQGLGLALVSKLVRDMDGRITYDREEPRAGAGGWTHFRIHLPMARHEQGGAGA
ncbi:ATP-binding protein [Croceibacterium sp. TMG7-5b_MA50]|uniref:two-component system sensor histidine kinase NtrB n=1 Tax=Croceibacterium sp. TMG7-5b_MA50 TaxID=3121290 RepID=UPI003221CC09